ncbi:hypothetical protein AB0M45_01285 [Nocardia sp. NPDC051787]|uniref:hypothetical protein n=1 Tax=Nocardia sp. NPDC051787 TaxID=3155415 RepID=UPI00343EF594
MQRAGQTAGIGALIGALIGLPLLIGSIPGAVFGALLGAAIGYSMPVPDEIDNPTAGCDPGGLMSRYLSNRTAVALRL